MKRLIALLAAAALTATLAVVVPASVATADDHGTNETCKVSTFKNKIRKLKFQGQKARISHLREKSYPGKTTVKVGTKYEAKHEDVVSSSVSASYGFTGGAQAMLKKVIGIYAEQSATAAFTTATQTITTKKINITVSEKVTIPAGVTVVWYSGYRYLGGRFQYSWCHHYPGMPTDYGVKTWTDAKFTSFGYRGDGGQRCDIKPTAFIAQAAYQKVCLG
jgi:hypothetical protein